MSLSHRKKLVSAIIATLLASTPLVSTPQSAFAQPAGEDDNEDFEGIDTRGADAANRNNGSEDDPEAAAMDGWGVGGKEEEGRFRPQGKTGRLKALEQKEAEESAEAVPFALPPPGFAYVDAAFAFGDMVLVGQRAVGATNVTPTASFVIGMGYMIEERWQVSARYAISTGASDGPIDEFFPGGRNPDVYKQIATGNVELAVKPHFNMSRNVVLPVGLALTLPTAQGDMFPDPNKRGKLGQAIVNQAAAASRGWEDRALFAYHRFGITPSAGLRFQERIGPGTLRLSGDMKFEIMVRTGGMDAPIPLQNEEEAEVRAASFNWVTRGGLFYDLFRGRLSPGLKLWVAYATAHEVRASINPGGAQFVMEPNLATHLPFSDDESIGLDARVGYTLPIGGELGGNNASGSEKASVGGLRLTAGMFFSL